MKVGQRSSHILTRDSDIVLRQTAETNHVLPGGKCGIVAVDDYTDGGGAHHFTEGNGRHVLRSVAHPNAVRGIDGHKQIFDQHLAGSGRDRHVLDAQL